MIRFTENCEMLLKKYNKTYEYYSGNKQFFLMETEINLKNPCVYYEFIF